MVPGPALLEYGRKGTANQARRKTMKKLVFSFVEGDGKNKKLLGGKGANLCEMTQIGINVPPGFVITTEACLDYLEGDTLPDGLMAEIREQIADLERTTGKTFGKGSDPLLVSVRSGSALSMPGMMDTVLNLGLNEETLAGLIEQTGDERFAYDAYRRFIQLFGKVALGIDDEHFDKHFDAIKKRVGVKADVSLDASHLREISDKFLEVVRRRSGGDFPHDVMEQLQLAVEAVFRSWMGKRAVDYRREFNITPDMANGTAVNICTMVFGNKGNDCATGVGFTRNPGTGDDEMFGEYLTNAQGEDRYSHTQATTGNGSGDARAVWATGGAAQYARVALQGSAGLRIHDRKGHVVLPANTQRQDECSGNGQNLCRHVCRETDYAR
jgi:pyruvate,orthophosphate dikinase